MNAGEIPYYILECFEPDDWEDSALVEEVPQPPSGESWTGGIRFSVPPDEPLHFTLDQEHTDRLLELDNTEALLVTRRLHESLVAAGVDNLDAYRAVIHHPTKRGENGDYVAVNVVGLVAAADLSRSTIYAGGGAGNLIDVDFEGVALNSPRITGLLMFRLAENTNALVVHARVRDQLLKDGFDMLTFVEPEEWIG